MQGTCILKRKDVSSLLTLDDTISAVENAFRMHAERRTLASGLLHIDSEEGEFHIKAGGLHLDRIYFALKVNGSFFTNQQRFGLPNIQGVIVLFDGNNGCPLAIMDSIEITILRTGAATAVAAKYLARTDSHVATICGCGNQGRIQLEALKQVLPITKAFAFDGNPQTADAYASEMSGELGISVIAERNLEKATQQSDVVITCTPSKQYYLRESYVRPGTFISAVCQGGRVASCSGPRSDDNQRCICGTESDCRKQDAGADLAGRDNHLRCHGYRPSGCSGGCRGVQKGARRGRGSDSQPVALHVDISSQRTPGAPMLANKGAECEIFGTAWSVRKACAVLSEKAAEGGWEQLFLH
jgi:ornithine cyclodeaminase/alanine dehydrogenase-like protein (mu-crystallin family)